ncbi:phosphotransferase [Paenibacillus sp. LMG 31456]|uniref:Phosphotransferase n=1 Tax=Paenibacillus foliorum TaxID=2654974 RepID=A0A972JYA0_9BACL|nr:phosphotransferase [Paenibacillus foliorum]NOU93324.1 phosphotransferase [Paenibacillus foliorum]
MNNVDKVIRQFRLQVLEVRNVPESYSSEVYRIQTDFGQDMYIKIPYNKQKLYREHEILKRLDGHLPVPKVLDYWEGDDSISGALLLEAIDGEPVSGHASRTLAFEIGCLHAQLHNVVMPGYGVDHPDGFQQVEGNDWRAYIQGCFGDCKKTCQEVLEPELYDKCLDYFDGVFSQLPEPDGPCLVHMDFRPGNLLVRDGRLVGLIDFESARGGSSEVDFTKVDRYLLANDPQAKESYIKGYQSVRPIIDLDTVLPFYSFFDAFSAVVWCKTRGLEKNRSFLDESIGVLRHATGTVLRKEV